MSCEQETERVSQEELDRALTTRNLLGALRYLSQTRQIIRLAKVAAPAAGPYYWRTDDLEAALSDVVGATYELIDVVCDQPDVRQ